MTAVVREEKKEAVADLKGRLDAAALTVIADYRGLTVAKMRQLRLSLRETGCTVQVAKNTFTQIALNQLGISCPKDLLEGPSIVITTDTDPAKTAKVIIEFAKENQNVQVKGGIFERQVVQAGVVTELASLPSREELIARAIGSIKSPLSRLVYTLSGQISSLVYVLNSVKEKKSGGAQ